jgi:hypothetical protein
MAYTNVIHLDNNYSFVSEKREFISKFDIEDTVTRVENTLLNISNIFMIHGLFRKKIVYTEFWKYEFFTNLVIDSLIVSKIAALGKIVLSPQSTYIAIGPRKSEQDIFELCIRITRTCTGFSNNIKINPLEYPLASIIGRYLLIEELQAKYPITDKYKTELLKKLIIKEKIFFEKDSNFFFNTSGMFYDQKYEEIIKHFLDKIQIMNKKKRLLNIQIYIFIKKIIKMFLPYGLIKFRQRYLFLSI